MKYINKAQELWHQKNRTQQQIDIDNGVQNQTLERMCYADHVAVDRRYSSLENGLVDQQYDEDSDPMQIELLGSECECALSDFTGEEWNGAVNFTFKLPDVGDAQVRGIDSLTKNLILRKKDRPQYAYVLVCKVGRCSFQILGWIYGHEGMRPEWWCKTGKFEKNPAWVVPRAALRSFRTLKVGPTLA